MSLPGFTGRNASPAGSLDPGHYASIRQIFIKMKIRTAFLVCVQLCFCADLVAYDNLRGTSGSPQTITFGALDLKTYGDAAFELTATASSELPVSYSSSNTDVATIENNIVTIVGAGT